MNVTLPDGTVIKDVPDGTTKAQLAQKLTANGMTVPKEWMSTPAPAPAAPKAAPIAPPTGRPSIATMTPEAPGMFGAKNLGEGFSRAANWTGQEATDLATKAGVPAPIAGGIGVAANVGMQAVPMIFGGGEARVAAPAMRSAAEKLMQYALKPTLKATKKGDAAVAIQEMLDRNIPLSERGLQTLEGAINDLNSKVSSTIQNSTGKVKVADIEKAFTKAIQKYKGMPNEDLRLMQKQLKEFKLHPLVAGKKEIPVQDAQLLKQGFYKSIGEKYGQEGTGTYEAQKAIARALKEDIGAKEPAVVDWNKEESRLLRTLNVAQRRVVNAANRNILGLKGLRLTQPRTFLAMMADESSAFKALMARILNAGKEAIPVGAARIGIGAAEAGGEAYQNRSQPPGMEARANGGPIVPGKPYLVGENGPEVIVPNHSGTVIPNQAPSGEDPWLKLIEARYRAAGNVPMQSQLAPMEHQAYYRERTAENPLMAPVYATIEPIYQGLKATGVMSALGQDDALTSPASLQQVIASWKGTAEGLQQYLKAHGINI